jgi:hypothetical protein
MASHWRQEGICIDVHLCINVAWKVVHIYIYIYMCVCVCV